MRRIALDPHTLSYATVVSHGVVGALLKVVGVRVRTVNIVEDKVRCWDVHIAVFSCCTTWVTELPADDRRGDPILIKIVIADWAPVIWCRRERGLKNAFAWVGPAS